MGHVLDGVNGKGKPYCMTCNRARRLKNYYAAKEAQP